MPHTFRLWQWEMEDTLKMERNPGSKPDEIVVDVSRFHDSKKKEAITWKMLENYGRYGQGLTTWPMNHSSFSGTNEAPAVDLVFDNERGIHSGYLHFLHSPSLDVFNSGGLKVAISINNSKPEIISLNVKGADHPKWEKWVADNVIHTKIKVNDIQNGKNTISIYHLDPGIILQRCFLSDDDKMNSYLGPYNFKH